MRPAIWLRWLHLGHRWLGMGCGLMVLLWFGSGLIMLWVARPQLDEAEHLAALPELGRTPIRYTPGDAWRALGLDALPQRIRLHEGSGRPIYRILADARWWSVDAQTGQVLPALEGPQAQALVQARAPGVAVTSLSLVDTDQWTVYRSFDPLRPFWRVDLADGRSFHVSTRSTETALDSSRAERAWNWLGSVVHWIYITPLRQQTVLWRPLVSWISATALLMALGGLVLGIQRLALARPYPGQRRTPYRRGWKRLHHLLGLGMGVMLATWLLSGWLSLAPLGLAPAPAMPPNTPLPPETLEQLPTPMPGSREIEWYTLGTQVLRLDKGPGQRWITPGDGPRMPSLDLTRIRAAVASLGPVAQAEWLQKPDAHYFSHRHHPRGFPVARVSLADPDGRVLYISPTQGRIELVSSSHNQAHRWLYQGLHRLDFPFLMGTPLLRELLILLSSLAGLILSVSGCVLGWQRLRRAPPSSHPPPRH